MAETGTEKKTDGGEGKGDKKTLLYSAVYDDAETAKADLGAFEELHKAGMIGDYDAAVIDQEDGKAHIVKRADRPRINVIPELFGGGTLKRKDLHEAAQGLGPGQAALIVVGEPTLEEGFDKAVKNAVKTAKHDFDQASDELGSELQKAFKQ
jgi:hypothetical protein